MQKWSEKGIFIVIYTSRKKQSAVFFTDELRLD